jgi:hypothetical protein
MSLCFTKYHVMETDWGCGGTDPHILNLGIIWRRVVSFTTRALYPRGRNPKLDRRLGGTHRRSGRGGEEKKSSPLVVQPVTQSVYLLSYPGCSRRIEESKNSFRWGPSVIRSASQSVFSTRVL